MKKIDKATRDKVSRVLSNEITLRIFKRNEEEIKENIQSEMKDKLKEYILDSYTDLNDCDINVVDEIVLGIMKLKPIQGLLSNSLEDIKREVISSEDDITSEDRKVIRITIARMGLNTYTNMSESSIMGVIYKSINYNTDKYMEYLRNNCSDDIDKIINTSLNKECTEI